MFPMGDGPFIAMRGPFIAAVGGDTAIALTGAVISDITGTTITVDATSSGDLSSAVYGVEYSVLDNGGNLSGYTFSKNTAGAVTNQTITIGAGEGVTADSTVTVRAYYNLDVLDPQGTRVYANDIVPVVVAGDVPSGTQTEGETLTQVQGIIAGSSPITVTYQWQNDGGTGTWGNIGGATSATYELQASDVGDDVAVVHTGTNSAGADNARSAETGPIAAAGSAYVQDWASTMDVASGSSNGYALTSVPTSGNMIIGVVRINDETCTASFSDDFGDAGAWSVVGPVQLGGVATTAYIGYKVVGTPSGGGKTVTVTPAGGFGAPYGITMNVAEVSLPVGALDDSESTATFGADPSLTTDLTTTVSNGLIIGFLVDTQTATQTGSYVLKVNNDNFCCIVSLLNSAAGTHDPAFTASAASYVLIGAAFK